MRTINCGIYKVSSKTFPDRFYIGASENLEERKWSHTIKKSRHPGLQNHIKRYGLNDLVFEVIELCNKTELQYKEQYWISELNPFFNTFRFASSVDNGVLAQKAAYKDGCLIEYLNKEHQILQVLEWELFNEYCLDY